MTPKELRNMPVRRKGSTGIWKVWAATDEDVSIMSWSQSRTMSKRIPMASFEKNWEIVTSW